jgi:aspartate aminotransferase
MAISPTLAADERVRRRLAAGERVVHLAFGEAGLPVLPSVREALARGATDNRYGSVAGSAEARAAAAGYFERRRLPTAPGQIVFAPGSKPLLAALLRLLPGDVVLPRPSWVSYAAQAALAGKRVRHVPIGATGGVPDPAALEAELERAPGAGVLVLTLPDNPTGTVADATLVAEVARIAAAHELAVVSDEIYRDLAFEPERFASPAEVLPERTFVTSGLSKSMALGGFRIGFVRVPDSETGRAALAALGAFASEVWSSLAAPMQHVAAHVLAEPDDVREHVARSRRLHRATAEAFHRVLAGAGVPCRAPGGGFYLYPDFEPLRERLEARGGDELAERLLDRHGVAVLPGAAFGDDPAALRARIAVSLLYGATEDERWAALASGDPAALPSVRAGLDALSAAVL